MSLKYERDVSFETDSDDDEEEGPDGGEGGITGKGRGERRRLSPEEQQAEREAAAVAAEEARLKGLERRRLYVRLLVGAGLLALSAAVVMLGMSLYSMEFR